MTMNDFGRAFEFIKKWEGGYSDDPNDPGGETKFGISKRSYPSLDIKNLTIDQARSIYYRDYWQASGAGNLGWPLSLVVFDSAVQHGVAWVFKMLQNTGVCWKRLILERIKLYTHLAKHGNRKKYLQGWLNRAVDLYDTCMK